MGGQGFISICIFCLHSSGGTSYQPTAPSGDLPTPITSTNREGSFILSFSKLPAWRIVRLPRAHPFGPALL